MRIKRGSDFKVSVQAKVNNVVLPLTGMSIIFSVKDSPNSSNILFQLRNTAAGGGDSQIEIVDADNGIILIKGSRNDTVQLDRTIYYCDCYVYNTTNNYIVLNEEFIIEKTALQTSESVSGRITSVSKYLRYIAEDDSTLTRRSGYGWTTEPVPGFNGDNIEVNSDDSEFAIGYTHVDMTNQNISYDSNGSGGSSTGKIIIKPEAADYPFEFEIWLY